MSVSALDKVLSLAGQPVKPAMPEAADLVRAAAGDLERIAVLLAGKASKGDGDAPPWLGKGKKGAPPKGKKKPKGGDDEDDEDEDEDDSDDEDVEACRAFVLEAMVALSQVQGGELLSLSVLTQAEREQPGAHTIPGSTDYPIPDAGHLGAAVARYKQGKFAGHPPEKVKAHILKRARALGKQVDLEDGGSDEKVAASAVIALARGGLKGPTYPAKEPVVAMDHEPMTGMHSHAHRVMAVHEHEHTHNGDNRHACGASGIYPGNVY